MLKFNKGEKMKKTLLTLLATAFMLITTGCSTAQPQIKQVPEESIYYQGKKPLQFKKETQVMCAKNTYTYKNGNLYIDGEKLRVYRLFNYQTGTTTIESTDNHPFPNNVHFFQLKKRGAEIIAQENGGRCEIR